MLYVKIKNGKAISASNEYPGNEAMSKRGAYENRNDWPTFAAAQKRAAELNQNSKDVGVFVATDSGPHVSPRYDVVTAPRVGEEVSYGFNGDYYPDGKVVSVSRAEKDFRIVRTDTGSVYYRRKLTGVWMKAGGTWALVSGHRKEWNPHF